MYHRGAREREEERVETREGEREEEAEREERERERRRREGRRERKRESIRVAGEGRRRDCYRRGHQKCSIAQRITKTLRRTHSAAFQSRFVSS
jgi:hypothetical protein